MMPYLKPEMHFPNHHFFGIYVKFTRCTYNSGSIQFNKKREWSPGNPSSLRGFPRETCIEMNRIIAYYTGILCVGGKFPESLALLMGNKKLTLAPPEIYEILYE